ncbi:YgaP family membrane protein [Brevibacillus dissolubilis]|uniref:YgaP family membrane protein n=1 Tax=Brevibacillus dissolubilis TaxID=1844116 RepID=UPI001116218C|nr:DUF2892 domain-containing protein [Brevibacillus dissolubilis]
MKEKQNVGTYDAQLRITLGLLGLAAGAAKMARNPRRAPWFLMGVSAYAVAEGITRYCPIMAAGGISTRKEDIISKALSTVMPGRTMGAKNEHGPEKRSARAQATEAIVPNIGLKTPASFTPDDPENKRTDLAKPELSDMKLESEIARAIMGTIQDPKLKEQIGTLTGSRGQERGQHEDKQQERHSETRPSKQELPI